MSSSVVHRDGGWKLEQLRFLRDDRECCIIGCVGVQKSWKSSLMNALLSDGMVFDVGNDGMRQTTKGVQCAQMLGPNGTTWLLQDCEGTQSADRHRDHKGKEGLVVADWLDRWLWLYISHTSNIVLWFISGLALPSLNAFANAVRYVSPCSCVIIPIVTHVPLSTSSKSVGDMLTLLMPLAPMAPILLDPVIVPYGIEHLPAVASSLRTTLSQVKTNPFPSLRKWDQEVRQTVSMVLRTDPTNLHEGHWASDLERKFLEVIRLQYCSRVPASELVSPEEHVQWKKDALAVMDRFVWSSALGPLIKTMKLRALDTLDTLFTTVYQSCTFVNACTHPCCGGNQAHKGRHRCKLLTNVMCSRNQHLLPPYECGFGLGLTLKPICSECCPGQCVTCSKSCGLGATHADMHDCTHPRIVECVNKCGWTWTVKCSTQLPSQGVNCMRSTTVMCRDGCGTMKTFLCWEGLNTDWSCGQTSSRTCTCGRSATVSCHAYTHYWCGTCDPLAGQKRQAKKRQRRGLFVGVLASAITLGAGSVLIGPATLLSSSLLGGSAALAGGVAGRAAGIPGSLRDTKGIVKSTLLGAASAGANFALTPIANAAVHVGLGVAQHQGVAQIMAVALVKSDNAFVQAGVATAAAAIDRKSNALETGLASLVGSVTQSAAASFTQSFLPPPPPPPPTLHGKSTSGNSVHGSTPHLWRGNSVHGSTPRQLLSVPSPSQQEYPSFKLEGHLRFPKAGSIRRRVEYCGEEFTPSPSEERVPIYKLSGKPTRHGYGLVLEHGGHSVIIGSRQSDLYWWGTQVEVTHSVKVPLASAVQSADLDHNIDRLPANRVVHGPGSENIGACYSTRMSSSITVDSNAFVTRQPMATVTTTTLYDGNIMCPGVAAAVSLGLIFIGESAPIIVTGSALLGLSVSQ